MIYCDFSVSEGIEFNKEKEVKDLIEYVMDKEYPGADFYVSVSVVTKDEIREINKNERNIDKVTDVLSFPNLNYDKDYNMEELSDFDFDPDTNSIILGDIVLCNDRIIEQAKEYEHSEERELLYLTTHSLYHLMGYDHVTEELKKDMRAKEKEIVKELNL